MTLSPAWLDELRGRTLLSALIGRTLKITRAGREFKACCPFHNERTPSFYINDEKGFYHCFGCSAHGDAIRWMTDQQGLPFIDAVKELAQAAGMEVPASDPRAAERAERANSLYDVTSAAAAWFTDQLRGLDGAGARKYLEKRGLATATIGTFGLGFAPDSRTKLKTALKRFGDDKLVEAGLLISVEDKEPYDRFRGRLMIPIRDPRGRVIAFGGRILGEGEPKYLNSPDTTLFDKGRTLYNLDLAAPASRKTGRAIVVEGYMDVIALAQAGIGDVVAPLGTALTEHQIERMWRLTDAPILCFDGDAAGQKAAVRAIGRALPGLAPTRTLCFATLPAGQDPDDLIRASGKRAMEALLDSAEPLVEKLWRHEREAAPLATPEARAGLKHRLTEHAQAIQDGDVRAQYLQEFRNRFDAEFGAKPRQAWKPGSRFTAPEAAPGAHAKAIGGGGIDPSMAKAILAGLIRHPALLLACSDAISTLPIADAGLARLRDVLLDAAFDSPQLDSAAINPICAKAGLAAELDQIACATLVAFSFTRVGDAELARRDLAMAIEALAARPELDAALAAATARLGEHWDEAGFAEQTRLLEARRAAERRLASLVEDSYGAPNF